jgi:EAL domain-containing protein (putative c-di-GMP-specific phosphodiesterase class I)
MDTPFDFEHQELHIEACIGIAVMSNDGNECDTLMQQAEVAVRRVLESGTERFEFYKPEFNRAAKERFKLESALRRAVERNELLLHYQPQVDLATGRIIGAEALLRWQHPELGMVPPGHFISLAEDTGLIVPIGAWVIRTACAHARRWLNSGSGDMRIAVNLSARQFNQPELVDMIASIVKQTELPAHCLEIELTETLVMTDVGRNVEVLNKLRELGIKLAIDDFGTGYSSLSYLKRFPIDMLKIDQSFVKELCQNSNDAAIASAIISMAHSMEMKVIAEGVETEEQCEFLAQQGCDEIQGYLFSRPLAPDDFENLLREGRRLPQYLLK